MNVRGTFRYATLGGYYDFQRWHLAQRVAEQLKVRVALLFHFCSLVPAGQVRVRP